MRRKIVNLNINKLVLESDKTITETELRNSIIQHLQTYSHEGDTSGHFSQLSNNHTLHDATFNMKGNIDAQTVGQQFTHFVNNSFTK